MSHVCVRAPLTSSGQIPKSGVTQAGSISTAKMLDKLCQVAFQKNSTSLDFCQNCVTDSWTLYKKFTNGDSQLKKNK